LGMMCSFICNRTRHLPATIAISGHSLTNIWPTDGLADGGNGISSTFLRPCRNWFLLMGAYQGQCLQSRTTDNWRLESSNCVRMGDNPTCNASCCRGFSGTAFAPSSARL
jgi:hypothetical protein